MNDAYVLSRVECKEGVVGGDLVFKGTRLTVNHVGKMLKSGESIKNVLEDYPYLNEDDCKFALQQYQRVKSKLRAGQE